MKEQEIKPLVSDDTIAQKAASQGRAAEQSGLPFEVANQRTIAYTLGGLDVRDLYEADRAPSRLLIEKLRDALGCGCGTPMCRRCDALWDEVDAFLKP